MEHKSELIYYNTDDGVWIECTCGWKHRLGFDASVEDASGVWERHLGFEPEQQEQVELLRKLLQQENKVNKQQQEEEDRSTYAQVASSVEAEKAAEQPVSDMERVLTAINELKHELRGRIYGNARYDSGDIFGGGW